MENFKFIYNYFYEFYNIIGSVRYGEFKFKMKVC